MKAVLVLEREKELGVDYRQFVDVDTPCKKKRQQKKRRQRHGDAGSLYPVTVMSASASGRLLIHYVGYSSKYNEWRQPGELVQLDSPCIVPEKYDLHQDLALNIKALLVSKCKSNPVCRVDMPFDKGLFDNGLRLAGYISKSLKGIDHLKISKYEELNELLGINWHYRRLNSNGDFCYAIIFTKCGVLLASLSITNTLCS